MPYCLIGAKPLACKTWPNQALESCKGLLVTTTPLAENCGLRRVDWRHEESLGGDERYFFPASSPWGNPPLFIVE